MGVGWGWGAVDCTNKAYRKDTQSGHVYMIIESLYDTIKEQVSSFKTIPSR